MEYEDMPPLLASPKAPLDEVEIRQGEAITINEALALASQEDFPIGKSTLQRWAKTWNGLGTTAPVKCVLITNRQGSVYKLDRSDFLSWMFEEKENVRPPQASTDSMRPKETPVDPEGHHETSQDLPDNSEELADSQAKLKETEDEIAALSSKFQDETILRKVHEHRANRAEEMIGIERERSDHLLKVVGAQELKLRELGVPEPDILRIGQPIPAMEQGSERDRRQSTQPTQAAASNNV